MQPIVIEASEYGILPDTGKDTAEKLRAVIEQAKRYPAAEVVLKAGTYSRNTTSCCRLKAAKT